MCSDDPSMPKVKEPIKEKTRRSCAGFFFILMIEISVPFISVSLRLRLFDCQGSFIRIYHMKAIRRVNRWFHHYKDSLMPLTLYSGII